MFNPVEAIKSKRIPKSVREVIGSQKKRKKLPASYFFLPKERKFPWRDPRTGKPRCDLIKAAIVRAEQHGYAEVARKARSLLQKYCKGGSK